METFKRVVSLLLCFVMLVGVVPFGAMATETTEPETTETAPVVEETEEVTEPVDATEATEEESSEPTEGEETEPTEGEATEPTVEETLPVIIDEVQAVDLQAVAESTNDYPEYPDQGATRLDKTATAVGAFSQSGMAQVELSMTGIYTQSAALDVVIMLDRSSSMYKEGVKHRISATVGATKAFIESIVKTNGEFNGNRILVMDFLGGNLDSSQGGGSSHKFKSVQYTSNEDSGYQVIETQAELDALLNKIEKDFAGQTSLYGTEYAQGLELCYNALKNSKADGHQQYCIFMSDGIPNYMMGEKTHFKKTSDIVAMFDVTNRTAANGTATRNKNKYEYEYYSSKMKAEGVTVYTVGLGLKGTNSAWNGTSKEVCEQVANMLLNDIAGPAYEQTRDTGKTVSKLNKYFFSVADTNAAEDMKNVFSGIAQTIKMAATDVMVEDKVNAPYTMIFDIPTGTEEITGVTDDLYIEFVEWALDADHNRTTSQSICKLYLGVNNGRYFAATDNNGTKYTDPVFEQKTIGTYGTKYYWTTTNTDSGISYKSGNTTYYFAPEGLTSGYNMTSGAFATGTISNNMSTDLVFATPYFAYNASNKMLYWTVDKLDNTEYALSYFVYLNNSATEVGTSIETKPGSYNTNEYAYLNYTNFRGTDCRKVFPIPQMTWNGAQYSYVYYLVNDAGQPVNTKGNVVPFKEAVFVTDVYTQTLIWNKVEGEDIYSANGVVSNTNAVGKIPDGYALYDSEAIYIIHVGEDESGDNIDSYFTIGGNNSADVTNKETTKVFNTKSDTTNYSAYGTYDQADVHTGFNFNNTTVAIAVVWAASLNPDSVVVDFGLPVEINVTANDGITSTLCGISTTKPVATMNRGLYDTAVMGTDEIPVGDITAEIISDASVKVTIEEITFHESTSFYYEAEVTTTVDGNDQNGFMYSQVTVIPATTIYYEDSFVDFTSFTKDENTGEFVEDKKPQWSASVDPTATQAQDRPGKSQIGEDLDANNNYGFDAAYTEMSQYSMGSAAKIDVKSNVRGEATFEFYGTGFDIIGLTSNTTGTLIVQVFDKDGESVKSAVVDTYYGYAYQDGEWVAVPSDDDNALYQVPVMKIFDLDYAKYTVKLTAGYNNYFDHTADAGNDGVGEYTLYLDAVRIYDPTGNNDTTATNAYIADGEGWPTYTELRDQIIGVQKFNALETNRDSVSGIVFIDGADTDPDGNVSIKDYTSYGPNNELYLATTQAVAFQLASPAKMASIQLALKTVGGPSHIQVYSVDSNGDEVMALNQDVNSATDLYYDITALAGKTVVIKNTGNSILSLTNIKTTYTAAPAAATELLTVNYASVSAALLSLRAPVVEEEEPSVPETEPVFAPEKFEVKVSKKSVKEGQQVDVTVTTSADVDAVSINGEMVNGKYDKKKNVYTWTLKIKTTAQDVGTMTVEVVAYDEDGVASEAETVDVTVTAKKGKEVKRK